MALNNKDSLIDLIMDADSILNEYLPSGEYEPIGEALAAVIDTIRNAKHVVHGEWVSIGGKGMRSCVQSCTACNRCSPFKTPFCPNCGADMRGGGDG